MTVLIPQEWYKYLADFKEMLNFPLTVSHHIHPAFLLGQE